MDRRLLSLGSPLILVSFLACALEPEGGEGGGGGSNASEASGGSEANVAGGTGPAANDGGVAPATGGAPPLVAQTGGSAVLVLAATGGTPVPGHTTLTDEDSCTGLALEPESILVEQELTTTLETQVPAPVALYVVLDNSMSMTETGASGTKWDEAVTALTRFVEDPASSGIDIAIQYFHPVGAGSDPDECDGVAHATPAVQMGRLPEHAPAIVSSLGSTELAQSTPTVGALTGGTSYCAAFQASHPDEKCVVVLVTDGQPNACGLSAVCAPPVAGAGGAPVRITGTTCVDPAAAGVLTPIAGAGLTSGVVTFTIGMAGVTPEGFGLLDQIAVAGGSDCTPDVAGAEACDVSTSGAEGFLAALNAIRDSVTVVETITEIVTTTQIVSLPCEWALPAPPAGETLDPTLVNVNVVDVATTPMVYVPSFAECPLAAGPAWYYDDALAPTKILVCPATCDLLTAQTTARVEVLLGCAREELLR